MSEQNKEQQIIENEKLSKPYDCKVTIRSKLRMILKIKERISSSKKRLDVFRNIVFGKWLDLDDKDCDNDLLNYVLHHQRPSLSKSIVSNILFDIAGRTLLLGRAEFCLVSSLACGKVVYPKYLDDIILPFVRRVFLDKLKKLEKKKAGLGKAAKDKAVQPSDKGDKDSVTIGDLGLDIGIVPQQLSLMDDLGGVSHGYESDSYTGQDGRGAIDGAKVSGEAMKDAEINPSDAAIDEEHMDVVGNLDENEGPNAKEDPLDAAIDGEHMDAVGNPDDNEGPNAKEPISHVLNTLVDNRDVLMTNAHGTINHADPPSHESEIMSPCGSEKIGDGLEEQKLISFQEDVPTSQNTIKAEVSSAQKSLNPSLNRSMDSDKYLEGQSMQRPPLFESDHFIYWKNRFETYVKAKDLDLWHIILNGDFPPLARNKETQILEIVPFEQQDDDLKKKLAKNNEAKMVLYNALPKKEYERIFMCKTAKDIWQSLLITHQGNSQVKDNKIDLLVQQYEQFTILEEESIDSGFARFNTIITSLKALDEGFSSKNYVRKFLRALHPKWGARVTVIEESKDLSSLALDELIGNRKVHEMVMEKDSEIYRGKTERIKSIDLKAKKEYSDDETSTSRSDEEEYAMTKGKSDQKCFRCGDPNNLISDCPKPSRNKDQKAFIEGSWSDSENDAEDKTNDETCLMAQSSNEVTLNSFYFHDNASTLDNDSMQIEYDSLCEISLKIINKNKILKTKRDLLEKEILELNEKIKKLERSKEIKIVCKSHEELKSENARLKETQVKFVKFDKSANSLREMLDNQKSYSCKIGLGFDRNKAPTSGTKPITFIGSFAEKAMDGSTIKVHGSTLPRSMSRTNGEISTEHVFSPPMSSRSDFVITSKKLIYNRIDESKKPSLKPSLKETESRSKAPPPRRNISSQPRHNTPQPRRNISSHQNFYPMN
ncbi:hypothetical protein Tco_0836192 [Tanacetum coccineum]